MSSSETAILAQVLAASGVLFLIAYLGNRLSFANRFVNALVTAVIFAAFYGVLAYTVDTTVLPAELKEAGREAWLHMILTASVLVFVLDLVANVISFKNRFLSALVTAGLFALLFGFVIYATGGLPSTVVPAAEPVSPRITP